MQHVYIVGLFFSTRYIPKIKVENSGINCLMMAEQYEDVSLEFTNQSDTPGRIPLSSRPVPALPQTDASSEYSEISGIKHNVYENEGFDESELQEPSAGKTKKLYESLKSGSRTDKMDETRVTLNQQSHGYIKMKTKSCLKISAVVIILLVLALIAVTVYFAAFDTTEQPQHELQQQTSDYTTEQSKTTESMKPDIGATVNPGNDSTNGLIGATGATGPQGLQGRDGSYGLKGVKGMEGTKGQQGSTGSTGYRGSIGNTGSPGTRGFDGNNGATGARGTTGSTGSRGSRGFTGVTGPRGNNGATGATGPPGLDGWKGQRGNVGATGFIGNTGSPGLRGFDGNNGATGATGPPGLDGWQGHKGNVGATGIRGQKGEPGAVVNAGAMSLGPEGIDGIVGPTGFTGSTGPRGDTGSTGHVGATGASGPKGDPGPMTDALQYICHSQADIVFILDGSSFPRIETDESSILLWKNMLSLTADVIEGLDIAENRYRVGIVIYDSEVTIQLNLDSSYDNAYIVSKVNSFSSSLSNKRPDIASALELVTNNMFGSNGQGNRDGVPNIAVLMTHHSFSDNVDPQRISSVARQMKDQDIYVVAVGVMQGPSLNYLQSLSYTKFTAFQIDDFSENGSYFMRLVWCITGPILPSGQTCYPQ